MDNFENYIVIWVFITMIMLDCTTMWWQVGYLTDQHNHTFLSNKLPQVEPLSKIQLYYTGLKDLKRKMTSDSRKIATPESTPYHLNAHQKVKAHHESIRTILESQHRPDKRKFEEARKICRFK